MLSGVALGCMVVSVLETGQYPCEQEIQLLIFCPSCHLSIIIDHPEWNRCFAEVFHHIPRINFSIWPAIHNVKFPDADKDVICGKYLARCYTVCIFPTSALVCSWRCGPRKPGWRSSRYGLKNSCHFKCRVMDNSKAGRSPSIPRPGLGSEFSFF